MSTSLLVSYSGSLGGAETVLLDFGTALPGTSILASPEGPLASAARERGLRTLALPERPIGLRGSSRRRLAAAGALVEHACRVRALLHALEPDLLVLSGMRSALALAGPGMGRIPIVVDHHDLLPGRWIGLAMRRVARRASLVVVPSRAVAEDLAVPCAVVAPGVELSRFEMREPPLAPVVLTLGALVPWKRPDLARAAVAAARRLAPELDITLRVAGAPLPGGEALYRELGDVAIGPVRDVPEALAEASCLLHCAPREPFGVAIIEALAAGRPVVAPAAGGPLEILDPSCGVLYPPGDAQAAGAALVSVLQNRDRTRMLGEAGRQRAEERFDVQTTRRRFASLVAPLIRRSANCNAGAGLAIVTVTHNSAPQLAALLRSVAAHLPEAQVVVADCASGDGSVAVGRAAGARVLALGENVGFGTACNRALGEVDVPACALLNPDIELLDASLAELASTAAGSRRLLAPLILSADGSRQDTVHPLPGSGAELLRALLPYTRLPLRATAPWNARQPRRVGWAIGAALVASTALLHELGPFDERIFMYAEDLDLALRARSAGVETWFDPRGRVLHHGAHSTAAAYGGEPTELLIRSRRTVVARRLGRPALARDDGAAAVRFAGRIAVRRLLGRPAAREWAQLRALCDG